MVICGYRMLLMVICGCMWLHENVCGILKELGKCTTHTIYNP